MSFLRKYNFPRKSCSRKYVKNGSLVILVVSISPEYPIRWNWNFQFFPNLVRPTYYKNINQIDSIDWATLVITYMQCILVITHLRIIYAHEVFWIFSKSSEHTKLTSRVRGSVCQFREALSKSNEYNHAQSVIIKLSMRMSSSTRFSFSVLYFLLIFPFRVLWNFIKKNFAIWISTCFEILLEVGQHCRISTIVDIPNGITTEFVFCWTFYCPFSIRIWTMSIEKNTYKVSHT